VRNRFQTFPAFVSTGTNKNADPSRVGARSSFPNDEALLKLLYLALRNIAKKGTRLALTDWKAALNRFAIIYEDRLPLAGLGDR